MKKIKFLTIIFMTLFATQNLLATFNVGGGLSYLAFNETEIKFSPEIQLGYQFLKLKGITIGIGVINIFNSSKIGDNEKEIIWALPIFVNAQYQLIPKIFFDNMDLIGSFSIGVSLTKLGLRYGDDVYYIKYVGWRLYTDIGFMFYYHTKGNGFFITPGFRYLKSPEIKEYHIENNNVHLNLISPFIVAGITFSL